MKLYEIDFAVPYVVTSGSKCRTLQVGDHVRKDKDGALLNKEGGGWLNPEQWEDLSAEVEIDRKTLEREIKLMYDKIESLKKMLGDSDETCDI